MQVYTLQDVHEYAIYLPSLLDRNQQNERQNLTIP